MELEFTPSSALYIKFENDSLNGTLLSLLPLSLSLITSPSCWSRKSIELDPSRPPPLRSELLSIASPLPPPPSFDPNEQPKKEEKVGDKRKVGGNGLGGDRGKVVPAWMRLGGKNASEFEGVQSSFCLRDEDTDPWLLPSRREVIRLARVKLGRRSRNDVKFNFAFFVFCVASKLSFLQQLHGFLSFLMSLVSLSPLRMNGVKPLNNPRMLQYQTINLSIAEKFALHNNLYTSLYFLSFLLFFNPLLKHCIHQRVAFKLIQNSIDPLILLYQTRVTQLSHPWMSSTL